MPTPTQIGKYKVEAEIGRGGYAVVYRAQDPDLQRAVAIKAPDAVLFGDPIAVERFRREAQTAAKLSHPNIVTIFDVGEADGLPFIAMELLDGLPLPRWQRSAKVSPQAALQALRGVGAALDYAHSRNVIHCDVKPSNIIVVPGRGAVLTDFGIARTLGAAAHSTSGTLGTPAYMAPEQASGQPATAATDTYALGVVLYEMLAGRAPFTGDTPAVVAAQQAAVPAPDPRTFNRTLPASVAQLLLQALDKDPVKRPVSAEKLILDLAAGFGGAADQTISAPPMVVSSSKPRRRLPILLIIIGAIIAAVTVPLSLRGCGASPSSTPTSSPTATHTVIAHSPVPAAAVPQTPTVTLPPINPQPTLPTGGKNLFIEYIMDASGSMLEPMETGVTKLEAARKVLADHMRQQPVDTNIGLRVYGHRVHYTDTDKSCQDVELIAPVATGQGERIGMWLASMQAQGMSPIGLSLRLAKRDFEQVAGRDNRIVLISDGKETCGIDPCREVELLKSQGFQVIVHVIGVKLDDEARTQLQCVAQKAGGTYQDVTTSQDLSKALDKVTQPQPAEPIPPKPDAPSSPQVPPPAPGVTPSATGTVIPLTYTPTPTVITGTPTTTRTATPPSPTATRTVARPTYTPTARPTVATNTPVPPTQPPTQLPAPPTQEPPPTKEPAPVPTKPPASTPVP